MSSDNLLTCSITSGSPLHGESYNDTLEKTVRTFLAELCSSINERFEQEKCLAV